MKSYSLCLSLTYFTKHNALKLHACHKWQDFTFSDGWIIFHCACVHAYVCISHFLYPFIHWWILQLFPHLGCLNNAAMNMVGYAYILGAGVFFFSLENTQKWNCWIIWLFKFVLFTKEIKPTYFQSGEEKDNKIRKVQSIQTRKARKNKGEKNLDKEKAQHKQ